MGSCFKKVGYEGRENAGGERRHGIKGNVFISPVFLTIGEI